MPASIVIPPNFWSKDVTVIFTLTDQHRRSFPAEITDASGWVSGAQAFVVGVDGATINIPCNDELPSPPGESPPVGSFWLISVDESYHQPIYHVQISSASPPTNWNELIEASTPVDPADIWSGRLGPADALAGQYQQFDGLSWQAVDPPAGTGDVTGPASAIDGNLAVFDGSTGKIIKDGGPPGFGAGDMDSAIYDPQNITADVFARGNHTGTQTLASISDAGNSASRNVGLLGTDVAAGDAPNNAVSSHDASGTAHGSRIPTTDQSAALNANASLSGANAVASFNDIAVLEEDELVKVSSDDSTAGYLQPKMTSGDGSIVFSVINPGTDEILDLRATGVGGGESNIGQNVGTGVRVYKGKNGVALQFRTHINTARITWTEGVDDLSATVPDGIFDPDGSAAAVQADLDAHKLLSPHPGHLLEVQAGTNVSVDNTDAQRPIVSADGDMEKSIYDPGNINSNAFNRGNHTGQQTLATISDSGSAAAQDVGVAIGDIPQLVDAGAAVPGLPAVSGALLTNLPIQSGTTDLSVIYTPTTFTIVSSTGNDGLVANAVASGNAGALSGARAALIDAAYGPSNQPPLFTSVAPGYVGASGGGTANFLRADGMWIAPSGGGDMNKAIYDPTNVNDDAFARGNHSGTQLLSTISDAGTAAARAIGLALTNVPELIDVGGGTPGFGVIDGRNLTNLPGGGWSDGSDIGYWNLNRQDLGNVSGAQAVDLDNGAVITATMTGVTTFTFSSTAGMTNMPFWLLLNTGGFSPTFAYTGKTVHDPADVNWSGSTANIYSVAFMMIGNDVDYSQNWRP